jgi:UDP-N-acetylmuramate dehydrogenase
MTLSQDPPRTTSSSVINDPNGLKTPKSRSPVYRSTSSTASTDPILLRGTNCLIKRQASLAALTSFRVGGPAELLVSPRTLTELELSLEWAQSQPEPMPITLLGAGSNLLISDRGLPGLVICTRHLRQAHFDEETGRITAAAGEPLVRLAWQAASRGWSGLEWAVGIPGTVGGAVVMNAGAHTGCMADILLSANVITPDGQAAALLSEDLGYRYRTSTLQGGSQFVTQATFQLQPGHDPEAVTALTNEHLKSRHRTQPYHLPSCGSVFRNPGPKTAGWLIEHAGLKGYQIGGAQVAERHANFILNCGGAQASDIFRLICHVQEKVSQQWALALMPEVKMLGEFPIAA